jgi:hypothetical protein
MTVRFRPYAAIQYSPNVLIKYMIIMDAEKVAYVPHIEHEDTLGRFLSFFGVCKSRHKARYLSKVPKRWAPIMSVDKEFKCSSQ